MTVVRKLLKTAARHLLAYHCFIQTGLTLGIGIGLSVISCMVVYNWEQKSLQAELQSKLDKIVINIEREISGNLEVVKAVSSLYNLSDEVKEQDFQTFVTSSLYRHPSIQAIAWLPRVSEQQRIFYETTAQKTGHPEFQITEQSQQGQIIRARQRQEYFPAFSVVSFFGKKMLTGLDFAANPIYKAALNRAAQQDEMVVTGIHLLREQDNQLNFLVFVPIYNQDIPKTSTGKTLNSPELRHKNLRGFVVGIFQIDAIVKTVVQDVNLDSTNLYLQDIIAPSEQKFLALYEARKTKLITNPSSEKGLEIGQKVLCRSGSACTHILNVENRRWLVQLLRTADGITPQKHWRSLATLIVGLLLTSIVSIYLRVVLRYTQQIEKIVGERTAQSKQLEQAFKELQQAQIQLVKTEKMSTLGLLVAGVAHEINNPINFISGNLEYANNYTQDLLKLVALYQEYYTNPHPAVRDYAEQIDLKFVMKDMPQLLYSMKVGAERILQLVLSLRNFSRLDESDMKAVNIHEGIDSTLLILQNKLNAQLNYPQIEIVKKYGDLPLVECYAGNLNQVFMNLIANAIDALDSYNIERGYQDVIDNPSRITIETEYLPPDYIKVRISDNGPGIIEDVKKRLFEPFFTTKPPGKGTGLGLSISYQIVVDKHKGALWCESVVGKGTAFCISLAIRQDVKQAKLTTQLKQPLKQDSRH